MNVFKRGDKVRWLYWHSLNRKSWIRKQKFCTFERYSKYSRKMCFVKFQGNKAVSFVEVADLERAEPVESDAVVTITDSYSLRIDQAEGQLSKLERPKEHAI